MRYSFGAGGEGGGGDEDDGGEGGGTGDGVLVARAACAQPAGAELLVSYGPQPDLVFALHYGFVPPPSEPRCRAELEAVRKDLATDLAGEARGESSVCARASRVAGAARQRLSALERNAEAGAAGCRPRCAQLRASKLGTSFRGQVLQRLFEEGGLS